MKILAAILLSLVVFSHAEDSVPPASAPAAPAAAAPAAALSVKVDKLTLTTGIKERQPIDETATFQPDFPVYAWVKYSGTGSGASLKFVWSADGKKVLEYPAELKSDSGRWWAAKKVWPGSWKVEVQSEKGDSLASAAFTVTAATAPAAPASAAAPSKAGGQ